MMQAVGESVDRCMTVSEIYTSFRHYTPVTSFSLLLTASSVAKASASATSAAIVATCNWASIFLANLLLEFLSQTRYMTIYMINSVAWTRSIWQVPKPV